MKMEVGNIVEFLENKSILVTGGTGFLAKIMPPPEYKPIGDVAKQLKPKPAGGEKAGQETPEKQVRAGGGGQKGKSTKPKAPAKEKTSSKASSEDEEVDNQPLRKRKKTLVTPSSGSHDSQPDGFVSGDFVDVDAESTRDSGRPQQARAVGAGFSLPVTMGAVEARLIKAAPEGNVWRPDWAVRDSHSLYKGELKRDVAVELSKAFALPADAPGLPDSNTPPATYNAEALLLLGQAMNSLRLGVDSSARVWEELVETRRQLQVAQRESVPVAKFNLLEKEYESFKQQAASERQKFEKELADKAVKEVNAFKQQLAKKAEEDKRALQQAYDAKLAKALADSEAAHKADKEKLDAEWTVYTEKLQGDLLVAMEGGYNRALEVVKPHLGDITPFMLESSHGGAAQGQKPPTQGDPSKKPPRSDQAPKK